MGLSSAIFNIFFFLTHDLIMFICMFLPLIFVYSMNCDPEMIYLPATGSVVLVVRFQHTLPTARFKHPESCHLVIRRAAHSLLLYACRSLRTFKDSVWFAFASLGEHSDV